MHHPGLYASPCRKVYEYRLNFFVSYGIVYILCNTDCVFKDVNHETCGKPDTTNGNLMNLSELLNRRVIFVSGKGGVGKTSVSVLLALLAARMKKKTVLVEMNSSGRIGPVFGSDVVGQEEIPLAPYITGRNLAPMKCFEEYVVKRIRFMRIYKTLFENRYVMNFMNAAPGLDEFLMLDKIHEMEGRFSNKLLSRLKYDLIIVDAPATGHGLSALEVPGYMASGIKMGPLHRQAMNILELLSNKRKTAFCLVTLAEELPVSESEEYVHALKERTKLGFGPMFVNAVMDGVPEVSVKETLPDSVSIFESYYSLAKERGRLNAFYREEIAKRFPGFDKIVIPFQFQGLSEHSLFMPVVNLMEESYL